VDAHRHPIAPGAADKCRIEAVYRVRARASHIEARAEALALEQSVELPRAAVTDRRVLDEVIARVVDIRTRPAAGADADAGTQAFDVTIAIAAETTGSEAGQLLNMLFGNSSLQDDVELADLRIPAGFARRFRGPAHGIAGIRALTGVAQGPLTCTALKPVGLPASGLAALAAAFARSGIDVVKDDHGLADQASAPFAERVPHIQRAIDGVNRAEGRRCVYAPSLTGDLRAMLGQAALARDCGVRMFLLAPMVSGVASLAALARELGAPLLAHPALAGCARIARPLLLGRLFRMFGADATIFPHAGGRFGWALSECEAIAAAARSEWHAFAPALPVPAGGIDAARAGDVAAAYGDDAMLLVGGSLLAGADGVEERCRAFVAAVKGLAQ
jgi:ribulose-bisphosphate carboxylase large chain